MFIILLSYKKPLDIIDKFLVEHRAFLDNCYKKNLLLASGPRNPRTGGVIISQLSDKQQLLELIKQDPFTINDLVDYEIIDFSPVKYHLSLQQIIQANS
jgi:uncharacterized protein YciI